MEMALDLAAKGLGRVEPNPAVGAVVVKEGRVVATGYHERFGAPHAEAVALRRAGARARGAELYVTLEPCAAFDGKKTPPCVELVARSGVRRVVVADRDPHPAVNGGSLARLRRAGVRVAVGQGAERNRRLNRPYFKRLRTGLPYVACKWAMSADGKIATRTGDSRWITSTAAREFAREMRRLHRAVLVGSGTLLADDPRLEGVTRVILDSTGRTPPTSKAIRTARRWRTIVCVATFCPEARVRRLRAAGAEVHKFEVMDLRDILRRVCELGVPSVLIEGGGQVHASAFEAGVVDEVAVFVAPLVIGGRDAPTPVEGRGVDRLADALRLREVEVGAIGGRELLLRGWTSP
jgi:diaminohydroxyphosphoribosylaminopyrimidine deaminase/5-amino-6-(5-phosphoribosylamino)uracil reductase